MQESGSSRATEQMFKNTTRSLPQPSSFHYGGSRCWFCNPQARKQRKPVEDSGCVCLFYYRRLIIAREVRGLTSISSNCCESQWASAEAEARLKTFPVQRLGPGVQGDMPNSFKVSPPRFFSFCRWTLQGVLKSKDMQEGEGSSGLHRTSAF